MRRLHDAYGATPVVTRGAAGGLYWDEGRVRRYRSPRVRVVDTTGAGDVFHGAFAAGLAHGLALPEAVARASRAGAVACTALGGAGRLATQRQWARLE
jgi:sugar/nucleoside kinase (ribokinase family)